MSATARSPVLLLLLLLAPSVARAQEDAKNALFAPVLVNEREVQPGWLSNNVDFGWRLPSIWTEGICYAANRAVILGSAHEDPEKAWMITFGSRMLSLGASDWANEKHRQAASLPAVLRCMPLDDIKMRVEQAKAYENEAEDGFITEVVECDLDQLGRHPCPINNTEYDFCEAAQIMMGWWLVEKDVEKQTYWKVRWEDWMNIGYPGLVDRYRASGRMFWFLSFLLGGNPCHSASTSVPIGIMP